MKRTRIMRILTVTVVAVAAAGTLAACNSYSKPNEMGLYYEKGVSEGNTFGHCFDPGTTSDMPINDEIYYLPASWRYWMIAPEGTPGADSHDPIIVNSKPEDGQPSGVQMKLWTQTNFTLNTDCGADNKDAGSPIVQFWDRIGRRFYDADLTSDKTEWWRNMLSATIVTSLELAARSVAREYTADELVSGVNREEVQNKIAALFQKEIVRAVGGEYFCSPSYDPRSEDGQLNVCGAAVTQLRDVDYANASVQAARDEKQAAIERAAALVIEAQGRVDAAAEEEKLYSIPGWVELQKAQLQKEMVIEACKVSPSCTLVLGGDGALVGTTPRS